MSDADNLHASVASFLTRNGWERGQPGTLGSIWKTTAHGDVWEVAVPADIRPRSREISAIAETVSPTLAQSPTEVLHSIEGEFFDFSLFRIDDDHVLDDTAPLHGSASVLSSAYGIYRAVATTQRRPRGYIGSGCSPRGDSIAARARLGHTRVGSFVLPVALPVEPLQPSDETIEGAERDVFPEERELSRSVAAALGVLDGLAVGPDTSLTPEETQALVASGVSYEVVRAVKAIVEDPRVGVFETTFEWAGALRPPRSVPARIEINAASKPRLDRIAANLREARVEPERTFSGAIVDIFYREGDDTGYIKVESSPTGRRADVEITIDAESIQDALLWKRDKQRLLVVGRIVKVPGKGLTMPQPTRVARLEALFR